MHTHTEASPDSRTTVADQARGVRAARIDVICATDHNTIEGGLRLRELADGFRVIVGEEISSRDGEIIGLFLERAVPRDLSGEETIARIHDQGGFVVVPHPFSINRRYHMRRASLDRLRSQIDALEIFNAREAIFLNNRSAAAYAKEHDIVGTGGSDAHRAAEIGRAFVDMPDFAGRGDFLDSLRQGVVKGRLSGGGVHVFTRYDRFRKWLGRKSPTATR
ncbi:MAG: PHP domain-containing protein [Chloroflexota bacterium]|nr:PHP domain-containing protein [Chloroflexota bacterium]